MYEDMDCCGSEIEAIDLEAEDLSTSDTVTVTWQIIQQQQQIIDKINIESEQSNSAIQLQQHQFIK